MDQNYDNRKGFSLTEILLAMGVLAIGMVFMAGVFPVGITLTTRATERTIAAVVADEAFATIRLLAGDPDAPILATDFPLTLESFEFRAETMLGAEFDDIFAYPSSDQVAPQAKQYYWSAVCRQVSPSDVQVTIFVCRKVGSGQKYWDPDTMAADGLIPRAYPVTVTSVIDDLRDPITGEGPVTLALAAGVQNLINDGYTTVDSQTGRIRQVLSRDGNELTVYAHGPITLPTSLWVVPSPAGGGRYPCIGVYQKVIRF